jgi:curved DNA-binding protein CbpA
MNICACGRRTNTGQSICDRCTALVVFGLTRDATQAEIKDAFRMLAKVWHPDRFHSDERLRQQAEEKLKEINAAYQLLTTTPAEEPHRSTASPPPPPEEPPRAAPETPGQSSAPWSPPGPITNSFAYAFELKRRAARIRVALTVLVLLVGAAWVLQRYGRELAYEFNIPIGTDASTTRQTTTAPEPSPKGNAGSPNGSNNSSAKSTHSRNATAAGSPSLLVYPDDDPRVAYFTVGSTKSDVVKVQGVPTKIADNMFEYGASEVYFQNGRVESWRADPSAPLKARMPE